MTEKINSIRPKCPKRWASVTAVFTTIAEQMTEKPQRKKSGMLSITTTSTAELHQKFSLIPTGNMSRARSGYPQRLFDIIYTRRVLKKNANVTHF